MRRTLCTLFSVGESTMYTTVHPTLIYAENTVYIILCWGKYYVHNCTLYLDVCRGHSVHYSLLRTVLDTNHIVGVTLKGPNLLPSTQIPNLNTISEAD